MHYQYKVKSPQKVKQGLAFLKSHQVQGIYEFQEGNSIIIGGFVDELPLAPFFMELLLIDEGKINWDEQWDTKIVNISIGQKNFLLESGPGFGDANHPTTQLCLKALEVMKPEAIIDIGSGSGILSIAATVLGAHNVISIEIDDNAISHHKNNLKLNNLKENPIKKFISSEDLDTPNQVIIMNMILSEQKIVLSEIPEILKRKKNWYVSGILREGIKDATIEYQKLGFSILRIDHLEKWSGLLMEKS